MKKGFIFMVILALCLAAMSALAEYDRVVDDADLITSYEEQLLEERIRQIVDAYDMDVAIVTKRSIGYRTPAVYAADFYEAMDYGVGMDKDGLIFLISMADRDYFTATHGEAIHVFTDYGLDTLHEKMLPSLSAGQYYNAFNRYLNEVEKYLTNYRETGRIVDWPQNGFSHIGSYEARALAPEERLIKMAPVIFLIALGIALIVAFSLKSQLKSVRKKQNATSYVQKDSFFLTRSQDIYLYTSTRRRRIETNTGSGSRGGSSTFRSSSGGSFGGRGGKF